MPTSCPTIAVLVPSYNDGKFISRCLKSVIEQASPVDELVVVDDASTDGSAEVILDLLAGCSYAKLVVNPGNLGVYGAVDRGLQAVTSDYVLFLSANDFVLPGIIGRARECLARHPGVGLWSAMGWLVDENDRPIRVLPQAVVSLTDRHFPALACTALAWRFGNWFTGTTVIYHRATLESVGRFDPAFRGLSDLISALMVASRAGAVFSPEPLAVFRLHAGSYLAKTLGTPEGLYAIMDHLCRVGPERAPRLFTEPMLQRTIRRTLFAAIRASGGARMAEYGRYAGPWIGRLLAWAERSVPARFRLARIAWSFLVLRPFDIVPTLLYRFAGTAWITHRTRRPA